MRQGIFINLLCCKYFVITSLFTLVFIFNSTSCEAYEEIDIPDVKALLDPPEVYIKKGTLYYNGKITNTSYLVFFKLVNQHPIKMISISSTGGDAENALKIANYIYNHSLDVDVRSVCASACANYIFPAGKYKYLSNDSYLLWHGGLNGPDRELTVTGNISKDDFLNLEQIKKLRKEDADFYLMIGVSIKLSFCPQLNSDYKDKYPEKWFSYTPEDLGMFGITNIQYATSASQWVVSMRKKHVIFAKYCN
ncbi:hypothetical protein IBT47_24585 [Erwinia sp. S43]|uniref:hypothetical protein n=1 Tax=Erwinia sp. S43 TaxID=2769339 RepID=UPI00190D5C00|nr:hypothetical protein [Erwinia sp. S43]MBK0035469.1 hypothetical protein [Erwinia sp. S43]